MAKKKTKKEKLFGDAVEPKKSKELFTATLVVNGETLQGGGSSVIEALDAIPQPMVYKTKGKLTVVSGDRSYDVLLLPRKMVKLFADGDSFTKRVNREQFAKFCTMCL